MEVYHHIFEGNYRKIKSNKKTYPQQYENVHPKNEKTTRGGLPFNFNQVPKWTSNSKNLNKGNLNNKKKERITEEDNERRGSKIIGTYKYYHVELGKD